jgi:hypothetical protein
MIGSGFAPDRIGNMLREIKVTADALQDIRNAIHSLGNSGDVLVFRGGVSMFSKEDWIGFLENKCQLFLDRRHFLPRWAAADARTRWELERDRATGAAVGCAGKPVRQRETGPAEKTADPSAQMAPADWWEVSYQPDRAAAYAYSNTRQPLHTDNAWFADPAEINLFIMQKQAKSGGEQTIYPLSRLIEDLSVEEPALFSDLCNTAVTIKKGDNDYFNQTSIIVLGENPKVFWNYYRTEKPTPEIQSMCDAFFRYLEMKELTSSVERLRCETGDCFCFNDLKMLHGRTAFTAMMPFERVLLQSMWRLPKPVYANV